MNFSDVDFWKRDFDGLPNTIDVHHAHRRLKLVDNWNPTDKIFFVAVREACLRFRTCDACSLTTWLVGEERGFSFARLNVFQSESVVVDGLTASDCDG